jgi:hypothetical protein
MKPTKDRYKCGDAILKAVKGQGCEQCFFRDKEDCLKTKIELSMPGCGKIHFVMIKNKMP